MKKAHRPSRSQKSRLAAPPPVVRIWSVFTVYCYDSRKRRSPLLTSPLLRSSAPSSTTEKRTDPRAPPSTSSHSGGPFCGVVLPDCPAFSSGSPAGSSSFLLSDDRPKRKTDKSARGF